MSAGIRVDSGVSAGTKYWIDRAVLRIGSDPQCDICLPSTELEPHAVTLEFRDGAIAWSFQQDVQPIEAAEVLEVLMEGPYRRSALREEMQNVRVEGNVSEQPCADAGHHGGSRQQHHPIAEREAQRSAKKPFRHEVG